MKRTDIELIVTYYVDNDMKLSVTLSDVDESIRFCEHVFDFKGGAWDYVRFHRDMSELYAYLEDSGIEVITVEEEIEEKAMQKLAEKYKIEGRCLCCDEIGRNGNCTGI